VCIRYRKAVRGYKYIENILYPNDCPNNDLKSRNATSESGHPSGSYASDRVQDGKEENEESPAECLEVGSATTRSSQGELRLFFLPEIKKGWLGLRN